MSDTRPLRVLHVFDRMDRGGAETWIVNVMRRIDREQFRFDFLVQSDQPGAYDDEIRGLGGEIHHAGHPKQLPRFVRAFRRVMRSHGPYDIVHSHVHHASGLMLALAAWQGVPKRIAHSHTDSRRLERDASLPRRAYYRSAEALINKVATDGLAASRDAAASLFGERWERDPRWRVLYGGIDLEPFTRPVDCNAVRARLGIPADAYVVGHVGRLEPVKNHAFLVDVFARIHQDVPEARLLLVGDGPLRPEIERKAEDLGIADAVIFAGVQDNIPEILRGAMDVFAFPSLFEGFGLAVVEAQAAGLPCVISDGVPLEVAVEPDLIERCDLATGPEAWAKALVSKYGAQHERRAHPTIGRSIIESPFNIRASCESLQRVYLGS